MLSAQITLKNPWAKVIDTITAKNTGSSDLSEFVACYPEQLASRIALIKVSMQLTPTTGLCSDLAFWWVPAPTPTRLAGSATTMQVLIKKERQDITPLEQPPAGAPAGVRCYKVTFNPAIKKGGSQEFDVVATITGAFKPNPAKIEQTERQYVEYVDNLYLLSPYVVESQSTVVRRPH